MHARMLLALGITALLASPADATGNRPPVGADAERSWREALDRDPERVDVRWRLMRAVYYRGDFDAATAAEEAAAWEEGRALAGEGIRLLALRGDGVAPHDLPSGEIERWLARQGLEPRAVARFYFWSSIHLGAWSRSAGLMAAVREGAANRLHAYLQVALAIEPEYDRGGPHRMLAALHGKLPRVPLITGWVDRDKALPAAERALAVDPEDPGNRYLWAVTILEQRGPSPETEAVFEEVSELVPRPGFEQEDAALRREAIARLRDGGSS